MRATDRGDSDRTRTFLTSSLSVARRLRPDSFSCRAKLWRLSACYVLATALALLGTTLPSPAQDRIDRPIDRPTFSPYLNLFRGSNNNSTLLNYYGLVRPQQQALQQNQLLGQQVQTLQQRSVNSGLGPRQQVYRYSALSTTGHPVVFNSFGGGAAAGGGGFGGGVGFGDQSFGGGFGASGGLGGGSFTSPGSAGFGGPSAVGGFGLSSGLSVSGHPGVFGAVPGLPSPGIGIGQ